MFCIFYNFLYFCFCLLQKSTLSDEREAGATKLVTGEEFDHSHSTGTHSKQNETANRKYTCDLDVI